MNELRKALMESVDVYKKFNGMKKGKRMSLEEVVLNYGRDYFPSALPKGFCKAEQQKCFENSAKLCLKTQNLIYVEGFASSGSPLHPVHHAWAVKEGATDVIDVTSDEFKLYYGIPFKKEYLKAHWTGDASSAPILDDWRNGWPLLKLSEDEFLKLVEVI